MSLGADSDSEQKLRQHCPRILLSAPAADKNREALPGPGGPGRLTPCVFLQVCFMSLVNDIGSESTGSRVPWLPRSIIIIIMIRLCVGAGIRVSAAAARPAGPGTELPAMYVVHRDWHVLLVGGYRRRLSRDSDSEMLAAIRLCGIARRPH